MNLLKETLCALKECNKQVSDIKAIGTEDARISWRRFRNLADFDYDNSYGRAEILTSLVIVFDDGTWLERGEYDGSEWWEYKSLPVVGSGNLESLERS